jgi:hypothetical protein
MAFPAPIRSEEGSWAAFSATQLVDKRTCSHPTMQIPVIEGESGKAKRER